VNPLAFDTIPRLPSNTTLEDVVSTATADYQDARRSTMRSVLTLLQDLDIPVIPVITCAPLGSRIYALRDKVCSLDFSLYAYALGGCVMIALCALSIGVKRTLDEAHMCVTPTTRIEKEPLIPKQTAPFYPLSIPKNIVLEGTHV
jgi:hypothetical protein